MLEMNLSGVPVLEDMTARVFRHGFMICRRVGGGIFRLRTADGIDLDHLVDFDLHVMIVHWIHQKINFGRAQ